MNPTGQVAGLADTSTGAALARLVHRLVSSGQLDRDDLVLLGIGSAKVESLMNAVDASADDFDLDMRLRVNVQTRALDRQVRRVVRANSLPRDSRTRRELRSLLAGYALAHDLEDLRIAFDLMERTGNAELRQFLAAAQPAEAARMAAGRSGVRVQLRPQPPAGQLPSASG